MNISLIQSAHAHAGEGLQGSIIEAQLFIHITAIVLMAFSFWYIFEKAGRKGWEGLIPIYNLFVLLKIVGRPGWWVILFFIPIVNFFISIFVNSSLAKKFGKGVWFVVGLVFLPFIFYPILAFGDAKFQRGSSKK